MKSCTQIFITRYLFIQIVADKWEHNQSTWRLLYEKWLYKCYNVYEGYIGFDTEQAENMKSEKYKKDKKLVFQKTK